MNRSMIAGAIAGIAICACAASAAAPALSIEKAVALAQGNLKERGLDREIHVVALTLEPTSLLRSRFHWFARWSSSIPREDRKREIGLQINMDGRLVHVLKAPAEAQGRRRNQAGILDLRGH